MTGTLCIYIHLDIDSVWTNRTPVRLGPVRVLTAQQFNPSFFSQWEWSGNGAPENVCLWALQT